MLQNSGVVPILEIDAIIKPLRKQLKGIHSHVLHCHRAAPSAGVVSCLSSVGGTVNHMFLVDACNAFYTSGFIFTTCLLLLVWLRYEVTFCTLFAQHASFQVYFRLS